jgi:hypothetical protein
MKKNLRLLILVVGIVVLTSLPSIVKAQTFDKGNLVGNLGVGFGWYGYSYFGAGISYLPAFSLSLEDGIMNIEKVGVLSVGGLVGLKHGSWNYTGENGSFNDFIIAARGAIHPDFIKVKKLDTYGGLAIGARIHNEKFPYSSYVNDNYVRPLMALYIGGRYYFTDKFSAFSELGYGLGYFTIGLSFKLK